MTTPTAFFYGGNDGLSNKTDVQALAAKISNLVFDDYIAEYNHIDFIFGIDAPKRLYNRIQDILEKFLREEEWKCQVNYSTRQASTIDINRQHNENDNWMRLEWGFAGAYIGSWVLKENLIIYMYLKYHNTFNRCRCRHLSRVPPAALSRNHITSKRLLLTGSLSNDGGDVKENGT